MRSRIANLEKRLNGDFSKENPTIEDMRSHISRLEKSLEPIDTQLRQIMEGIKVVDFYSLGQTIGKKISQSQLSLFSSVETKIRNIKGTITQQQIKDFVEEVKKIFDNLSWGQLEYINQEITPEDFLGMIYLRLFNLNGLWGRISALEIEKKNRLKLQQPKTSTNDHDEIDKKQN